MFPDIRRLYILHIERIDPKEPDSILVIPLDKFKSCLPGMFPPLDFREVLLERVLTI
jgi:hypothetical protein